MICLYFFTNLEKSRAKVEIIDHVTVAGITFNGSRFPLLYMKVTEFGHGDSG